MERKVKEYQVKEVNGYTMKYPINYYLSESKEEKLLEMISENKSMSAESYLRWMLEESEDSYLDTFPNYYIVDEEQEKPYKEASYRRSMTDILGCYLTYFPNRNNSASIWVFIKAFVKVLEEYNYIGHFCTDPYKVVFYKPHHRDDDFLCKWDNIPLSRLTWLFEEEGAEEDDELTYEDKEGNTREVYVNDYNYLHVDTTSVDATDLLTPQNYLEMFREAI